MINQNEKLYKIILFDGICNFCNYWVNFILDRDKDNHFKFAALQSQKGKELLKQFSLPEDDFDSFILISQSSILKKSSAAFEITKNLKGWVKIINVFSFLPHTLTDFFYDLIAKNRYRIFGKREVCRIPTEKEKNKFL